MTVLIPDITSAAIAPAKLYAFISTLIAFFMAFAEKNNERVIHGATAHITNAIFQLKGQMVAMKR